MRLSEDVNMDRRLGDTPMHNTLTRTRSFRKPWISRSSKACQHRKRLHRTINSVKKLQRVFSWRFSNGRTQTAVFFDDTYTALTV